MFSRTLAMVCLLCFSTINQIKQKSLCIVLTYGQNTECFLRRLIAQFSCNFLATCHWLPRNILVKRWRLPPDMCHEGATRKQCCRGSWPYEVWAEAAQAGRCICVRFDRQYDAFISFHSWHIHSFTHWLVTATGQVCRWFVRRAGLRDLQPFTCPTFSHHAPRDTLGKWSDLKVWRIGTLYTRIE